MKLLFRFVVVLSFLVQFGCSEEYSTPEIKDVVRENGTSVVLVYSDNSQGSGVVVGDNGKIATNNHVVEGSKGAIVKLVDGRTFYVKGIISSDSKTDIAILKIDAMDLKTPSFGNSALLEAGDKIVAIGNPKGLENTVTDGIVSTPSRMVSGIEMIQISAPISPGSSGGGLFNMKGQLVGITTSKINEQDTEGIGFAVPINLIISNLSSETFNTEFQVSDEPIISMPDNSRKINPFFPFLTSFAVRLLVWLAIAMLLFLIIIGIFKNRISNGNSPISVYSFWASIWLLFVLISAFFLFADLTCQGNITPSQFWSTVSLSTWILLGFFIIIIFVFYIITNKSKKNIEETK